MAQYREAVSIAERRERYLRDAAELDADELEARYGRGARPIRPVCNTLLAPLYTDEEGREYTPDTPGDCAVWWVRIPPSITRRQRAAGAELTQFPLPGDKLQWTRVGRDSFVVDVTVAALVDAKIASAQLHLAQPVDATRTDAEVARRERVVERRTERGRARLRGGD